MENITVSTFLTVIIPMVSAIGIIYYISANKISELKQQRVQDAQEVKNLDSKYNEIKAECTILRNSLKEVTDKRVEDQIKFTEILAKLNVTLAKVETTIKHFEETLSELKEKIK